jgi:hypothetical protein
MFIAEKLCNLIQCTGKNSFSMRVYYLLHNS